MAAVVITPRDRLGFTLFLAVSLHAALILGVSFSGPDPFKASPTIEVTLATHADSQAPDEADFIAQANQLGSGTEAEALETTTDQYADFHSTEPNEIINDPQSAVPETVLEQQEVVSTTLAAEEQAPEEAVAPEEATDSLLLTNNETYQELAQEIASLEARIAQEQQAQAKRPRVKRLTSVSTKTADEAAYLNMWRNKVERIGNANYPASGVHGSLRMLVVIRYDGTLEEVRLLDTSGHKVLDDAALRIVRLAAPYQDFPIEMRKKYDRLEIIRTWQFSQSGNRLGS